MYDCDALVSHFYPDFKYRQHQRETIVGILEAFLNRNTSSVVLDAPTGSGKSWIARQVAEIMNNVSGPTEEGDAFDSLFLTKTIALQNQYLEDFPEMRKLMGATNYSCHSDKPPPIPPKQKAHTTCKYTRASMMCEYLKAKEEYKDSPMKILNYAFYLTGIQNYNTDGLLICDEAHNLPNSLIQFAQIVINIDALTGMSPEYDINDYINIPKIKEDGFTFHYIFDLLNYVKDVKSLLQDLYDDLNEGLSNIADASTLESIIEKKLIPIENNLGYLNRLYGAFQIMLHSNPDHWIISKDKGARDLIFEITPLFVPDFAISALRRPAHVLYMTATPGKLMADLKLADDVELFTIPYTWPLENRPFHVISGLPNFNYDNREIAIPAYVEAVDGIMEAMEGQSGIIHTASYANAEHIIKLSKFAHRMYVPTSREVRNIKDILKPGRVLVSPSLIEGIDLPGDLAAFQLFFKISYPSLGDPWVCAKKDADPGWYDVKAITDIIQGSGRAIRSPDDTALTIMLDQSFNRLLGRAKVYVPEWFLDSIS